MAHQLFGRRHDCLALPYGHELIGWHSQACLHACHPASPSKIGSDVTHPSVPVLRGCRKCPWLNSNKGLCVRHMSPSKARVFHRACAPPARSHATAPPALVLGSPACQKRRSVLLDTISLREGGHLNNNRLASIKLRHLLDIWQPERGLLKGKQIRAIIMPGNGFWFNNDHVSELSASGNSYHSQM